MRAPIPNEWSSAAEWANAYRAEELCVVPARHNEKRPALAEWATLQESGVPAETHARWYHPQFGEHRFNNRMGFITGPVNLDADSALFVIDLDEKDGVSGKATWQALLDAHERGIDFDTWRADTGTGGQHLYFRCSADRCPRTQKHISIGIDVRGVGGFIMAPPSTRTEPGARSYDWVARFSPFECDLAEAPDWLLVELEKLCGPTARTEAPEVVYSKNSLGLDAGKIEDGREAKATFMVFKAFARLMTVLRRPPTADELFNDVWPVWEKKVDTQAQGKERGASFIMQKCAYIIPRYQRGLLKDLRSVEDADALIAKEGSKRDEYGFSFDDFGGSAGQGTKAVTPLEVLSEEDLDRMPPPEWLIEDFLFEDAWGYIWGAPGTGKSFVALDMACHIAYGLPTWHHGKKINLHGDVLYLVQEGVRGFGKRLAAFRKKHGIRDYSGRIRLIRTTLNFMDPGDIQRLIDTIKAENREFRLIVVDTFSRVIPGAEENAQEDMTIFIAASNKVREVTKATLLGVHHSNAAGERERGSTTLRGAADMVFQVNKTAGDMAVEITCNKMKDDEDGWKRNFRLERVELTEGSLGIKATGSLVVTAVEDRDANANTEALKHCLYEFIRAHQESGRVYGKTGADSLNSQFRRNPGGKGISAAVIARAIEEMEAEGAVVYGRVRVGSGARATGWHIPEDDHYNS